MTQPHEERVRSALADLPADIVMTDPDLVGGYVTDFRRQYTGRTQAVLRPRTTAEVQHVVRTCLGHGVPLVPVGGNTGYCAVATPDAAGGELVLSLERMNAVRELDVGNLSLCAEAGAILGNLQRAAAEAGLMLPLALGSQDSCRIGGNLATNAGGLNVVRYGMARELVIGLEAVLADGTLLDEIHPLRKNNASYDVKQLLIGTEGTLGIITAVSQKLRRAPRQSVTAFLAIDDPSSLAAILDGAQVQTGEQVSAFEYVSDPSLPLLLQAKPDLRHPLEAGAAHYVLLEAATASPALDLEDVVAALLGDLVEEGLVTDGTVAANGQQRAEFWNLGESISEAEVHHSGSVKHDVAIRMSRLAEFVVAASALVTAAAPDAVLSVYGYVGDGNVHFNVVAPSAADASAFKARIEREVSPAVHELNLAMGATFSVEYGIGRTKLELLERHGDPGKVGLMRRLKVVLDPAGIMNPGKVVRVH